VALVHVERGWLDAQRAQQAHAADAEQGFLHDARGAVAAIDARGQVAEMLFVLRQVGVEQIDRHAAHVDAPDLKSTTLMPISTLQTSRSPSASSTGSSGTLCGSTAL
jgi:hypothetical protein